MLTPRSLVWLTRQQIAALRLDLDTWVRAALSTLLNHIARLAQVAFHLSALEEGKIERNLLAPQCVYVLLLLPAVKREQHQAARPKHTSPFTQDSDDLWPGNVNDRIEGDDPGPGRILRWKLLHNTLLELDARVELACQLDHARRKVKPHNSNPRSCK